VVIAQTGSQSCNGGSCCAVRQSVSACPRNTVAVADVNGVPAACSIVLQNKTSGELQAFVATPKPLLGTRRFPAGVAVAMDPGCGAASGAGPASARLSCMATFAKLPHGFRLPPQRVGAVFKVADFRAANPQQQGQVLLCGSRAFRALTQSVAVDPVARSATFTVECV
jgi:hypothetical protein